MNKFNNLEFGETVKVLIDSHNKREESNGKRKKRFEELHLHNQRKILRNSGQCYFDVKNHFVPKKTFKFIQNCCIKKCHEKVSEEVVYI